VGLNLSSCGLGAAIARHEVVAASERICNSKVRECEGMKMNPWSMQGEMQGVDVIQRGWGWALHHLRCRQEQELQQAPQQEACPNRRPAVSEIIQDGVRGRGAGYGFHSVTGLPMQRLSVIHQNRGGEER
jgi:hypothetical protein